MFHVELRQFPHVTRAFNLSGEELRQRVLVPWAHGRPVELGERRWSPEKARLTIYEGPRLGVEEMGLGRGWGNVTRSGREVTDALLAEVRPALEAAVGRFKDHLTAVASRGELTGAAALSLAQERAPMLADAERLALVQRAVWELLLAGEMRLVAPRRERTSSDPPGAG